MKKVLGIPAISPELNFVAKNSREIEAILDCSVQVSDRIRNLTARVSEQGEKDGKDLLFGLAKPLENALRGIARIGWSKNVKGNWQFDGQLYAPRGSKKKIASLGINITFYEAPRLICWYFGPGGLDGHRRAESLCKHIRKQVYFAEDYPDRLPGWGRCLVWLDKPLLPKTTDDELERALAACAKQFFRAILKPHPSS